MDKNTIKFIFGIIIFLFGVALGYFTASYMEKTHTFDYYNTLLLFGGAYLAIGILIAHIFPVSLGLLFGADMFILHVLAQEYRHYEDIPKILITGSILVLLYWFTWAKLKDNEVEGAAPSVNPP